MIDPLDASGIPETDNLTKLKRKAVQKYLTSLNWYSGPILEEAIKYLNSPFMIERLGKEDLPNIIVLRRGGKPGIDIYYTNNFVYSISKYKAWDKDIILITD